MHPSRRWFTGWVWVGVSWGVLGCASDTTGPTQVAAAQLFYHVTLNHHAITMALTPPYDTLQLVATASAASGDSLPERGHTTWTTSDSSSVRISPTGLLTALATTTGVTVTVYHTVGNVTQIDSATINVTDTTTIPRLATIAVQPESLYFGVYPVYLLYGDVGFTASALDAHGDTIPNVAFRITSATPAVLAGYAQSATGLGPGWFQQLAAGHASILTEATVYGVRKVDTLQFTAGWWQNVVVQVLPQVPNGNRTQLGFFSPAEDTIAVGGTVAWVNLLSGQAADVVFDDSTAVQAVDSAMYLGGFASVMDLVIPNQAGGNIPAFAPLDTGGLRGQDTLGVRARSFPVAGTYRYHSALYGTSGVIRVLPASQIP